jgi:hypothetical protein
MAEEEKSPAQLQEEMFKAATSVPAEPEAPPEPTPTTPAESPPPAEPAPAVAPPPTTESEAAIPSWRLREEAEARRRAEDHARALEKRLGEIEAHVRQTQSPATKSPDFFENPSEATKAIIAEMLMPVVNEMTQNHHATSRMIASQVHGSDKVTEAEEAFLKARDNQSLDPADYERVVQSRNRYDAVVQWYRNQGVLTRVGHDPETWFKNELAARMKDPGFQAEMLKSVQGSAAERPSITRVPPSLSRATAVGDAKEGAEPERKGDLSDSSLFDYAFRQGRQSR